MHKMGDFLNTIKQNINGFIAYLKYLNVECFIVHEHFYILWTRLSIIFDPHFNYLWDWWIISLESWFFKHLQ